MREAASNETTGASYPIVFSHQSSWCDG